MNKQLATKILLGNPLAARADEIRSGDHISGFGEVAVAVVVNKRRSDEAFWFHNKDDKVRGPYKAHHLLARTAQGWA